MPHWLDVLISTLTVLTMLVGLFGLVIPIFPGIVIIWLAALVFGIINGFGTLGVWMFVLISLLMLVGVVIDNVMMSLGARQGGAAWSSILLGVAAGIIGTLIVPPIGGLIAAPAIFLLMEYRRQGEWQPAWEALRGLLTGWGLSFVVRFLIGVLMIALWALWAWKG